MELRRYWQIILKRHRTLLWIIGVIVGVAILGSLITTPVYMFYSNVWIKTSDPKSSLVGNVPSELAGLGMISSDLVMYGQLALIKNLSLIQNAINELGLKDQNGQPYAAKDFLNPGSLALVSKKTGVTVKLLQNTQMIQVQGFSSSPQEAAEIANRVAAAFVDYYNGSIQTTAKQAHRFIQESIPRYSDQLRQAEEAVANFKVKNHISNISYYRERLLTALASLKDERDSNEREVKDIEKRIEQTVAKLKKIPEFRKSSLEYRTNPTLSYLREKLMDLESSLANTEAKVTPEHPASRQVRASLNKLKEEYKKQVASLLFTESTQRNSIYDSLLQSLGENEINLMVRTARRQVQNQLIVNKQEELDDLTRKEMALDPLVRQVSTLQTILNNLMNQEQVAKLASDLNLSNAIVAERAVVPTLKSHIKKYRWFPQRTQLVMFAFLFGLLLGLATIYFREYMDDSFSDPVEAETFLQLPVLAGLPELPPLETYTIKAIMGYPPWKQAVWALPDVLKPADQGTLAGIWAITSAGAREGKTLVAASLGWALASRGQRVLLVDLNFSHPTLSSLWQLPAGAGVREVLQGTASLTECVRRVEPGALHLLPNGKAEGIPWPQLGPAVLANWLASIKKDYEVLLLDLPGVGDGERAPWSALGEQTLLVMAAERTSRRQVARALEQIRRCQGRVVGMVLNGVKQHELWPIISPTIMKIISWPPIQRLVTRVKIERDKLKLSARKKW
jgi:uncharacterized protein involved in exopolysaccharide biosynthesis/MinD-like ATPase involved in chromosome partitioning or flagellar assembly